MPIGPRRRARSRIVAGLPSACFAALLGGARLLRAPLPPSSAPLAVGHNPDKSCPAPDLPRAGPTAQALLKLQKDANVLKGDGGGDELGRRASVVAKGEGKAQQARPDD